jgi:hypothetical protein
MDKELQKQATQWAESVSAAFLLSYENPANPLSGEALEIYKELQEWGWFALNPVTGDTTNTKILLGMKKYAKLKWAKDHPPKVKLSRWEVVTGKGRKR